MTSMIHANLSVTLINYLGFEDEVIHSHKEKHSMQPKKNMLQKPFIIINVLTFLQLIRDYI